MKKRMFNFFRKTPSILAPITGKVIELGQVPDEVFAQKLAGDGIAIDSTGSEVVAPADGVLSLVFNTGHAFAITLNNGIELLVHIGIDTVALNGQGFTKLVKQGTKIKAGTPIIKLDREIIEKAGYSLITPVLITNPEIVKDITGSVGINAEAGKTSVIEYKMA